MRGIISGIVLGLAVLGMCAPVSGQDGAVRVFAGEKRLQNATHECSGGHQIDKRQISFDSGKMRYILAYSGCIDPSHGDKRPSSEGNFGMPSPSSANWYHSGFLRILINGEDAVAYRVAQWQVIENDRRGTFQVIFAHPDADVGLRIMMLPDGNHLLANVKWLPREGANIEKVTIELRSYPSFFTAARNRAGERHCRTPRTDMAESATLELVPEEDIWMLYYDTVFDVARGEGDGPCAALVVPEGMTGGNVRITSYPVTTSFNFAPQAGEARFAVYDFAGKTNAEALQYMQNHGARDQKQLAEVDFRPASVTEIDLDQFRRDALDLLEAAGAEAASYSERVDNVLQQADVLRPSAQTGDWQAEAELGQLITGSQDLLWKLRAQAVLNNPKL